MMVNSINYADIRRTLAARRLELSDQIHDNLRAARAGAGGLDRIRVESGEAEVILEDELTYAQIQIRGQVLEKINEALRRLDAGMYGRCGDCGDAISIQRLRALPFALRCKNCEETREYFERLERARSRSELRLSSVPATESSPPAATRSAIRHCRYRPGRHAFLHIT